MGIGSCEKKRQRMETDFDTKRVLQEEQSELNENITVINVDMELELFRKVVNETSVELLYERFRLMLKNYKETYPNLRSITFVFDYAPRKTPIKYVIRNQQRKPDPIPENYVTMFDFSRYVGPEKKHGMVEFDQALISSLISVKQLFQRYMHTPYLKRCVHRLFAAVMNREYENSGIETVRVLNVEQEDGPFLSYENGQIMNRETPSAGEAELDLLRLCSAEDRQTHVMIICGDSDLLGAVPLFMMRNPQSPRIIVHFGTVVKIFDMSKFFSGLLQWGITSSVQHMPVVHAFECAMSGSDYVNGIAGLGDARINAFMKAGGYRSLSEAIEHNNGLVFKEQPLLLFFRLLLGCEKPRGKEAKNEREELFLKFKNGEDYEVPTFKQAYESTAGRRSSKEGVIVPNEQECIRFIRSVLWQVHYWYGGYVGDHPDPFEKREDKSYWGWELVTGEGKPVARLAPDVFFTPEI